MKHLTTPFSRFLGALVGPISTHIINTNLNFALKNVFSWVIVLSIKATNVFMFHQIVCISPEMLSLMKTFFLSQNCHLPLGTPRIHHPLFPLTNLKMLHMLLFCYLTMVQ